MEQQANKESIMWVVTVESFGVIFDLAPSTLAEAVKFATNRPEAVLIRQVAA